jgi:hypothetical protein
MVPSETGIMRFCSNVLLKKNSGKLIIQRNQPRSPDDLTRPPANKAFWPIVHILGLPAASRLILTVLVFLPFFATLGPRLWPTVGSKAPPCRRCLARLLAWAIPVPVAVRLCLRGDSPRRFASQWRMDEKIPRFGAVRDCLLAFALCLRGRCRLSLDFRGPD